jgi:Fe-S cluster biogenesis protein NfuA/nitrite reductase/ring-hydroxylating ferredoxin subunit
VSLAEQAVEKLAQKDFRERMGRIDGLVRDLEGIAAPAAQAAAKTLLQALLDLYGTSLERIFEIIYQSPVSGQALIDELAQDELVGSLLLLHGLHPLGLETRVTQALEKVRPYLGSHGGNVELIGLEDGLVRLRLQGSCNGCPSSAMTLKLAIEEALQEYAPDMAGLVVEGVVAEPPKPANFVPLSQLHRKPKTPPTGASLWLSVGDLPLFGADTVTIRVMGDTEVLFCRLNETLYAYRNLCPGCGKPLNQARLVGTALICPTCRHSYDVMRAGRDLDQPALHLDPLPLLEEHGQAKIALPIG